MEGGAGKQKTATMPRGRVTVFKKETILN